MSATLHLLHGWGFDASFWDDLAEHLRDWTVTRDDRGYFGVPEQSTYVSATILITHSFGTLRALRNLPPDCRGLVAINGFDRLISRDGSPGVAPRAMDAMVARFSRTPELVLAKFRKRCGAGQQPAPLNINALEADLLALRSLDCTAEAASIPLLSLQGATDPIVDNLLRDHVFSSASRVTRAVHPTGGHLLPLTAAHWCAAYVREFVEQLT